MSTVAPVAGVLRYAERCHEAAGDEHHVASPLGAWLVLALAGEATSGEVREELADALGCDVATAAATAATLLDHPHPLVAAAAAAWRRPGIVTDALTRWLGALPDSVDSGDIPSQPAADSWARERSLGLIDRFPLVLTPEVVVVLASALATRVSWHPPYALAPAADLGGRSAWAGKLTRVLRAPEHGHAGQYIAMTDRAGDVAVHTARARGGLSVTSVIAAALGVGPSRGYRMDQRRRAQCPRAGWTPGWVQGLAAMPDGNSDGNGSGRRWTSTDRRGGSSRRGGRPGTTTEPRSAPEKRRVDRQACAEQSRRAAGRSLNLRIRAPGGAPRPGSSCRNRLRDGRSRPCIRPGSPGDALGGRPHRCDRTNLGRRAEHHPIGTGRATCLDVVPCEYRRRTCS
jgi:hypothetical protein